MKIAIPINQSINYYNEIHTTVVPFAFSCVTFTHSCSGSAYYCSSPLHFLFSPSFSLQNTCILWIEKIGPLKKQSILLQEEYLSHGISSRTLLLGLYIFIPHTIILSQLFFLSLCLMRQSFSERAQGVRKVIRVTENLNIFNILQPNELIFFKD